MVLHDFLTTISCEICSEELSVTRNWGETRMRKNAAKHGWRVVDGKDVCPKCAARMEKE